ncbi:WYL domain-containing protein [Flavobacteriales bacterium]|nr:WYL domain-containing protein [Flavobacteriales bacterium]
MAINKNALLRYQTLDKCFANSGRKYYIKDLLETVNHALLDYNPDSSGIQKRQLWEDIKFMKSDAGYSAPIETVREGKKAFYRYQETSFSINNSPLNSTEAEQLKSAISVLHRFEGTPGFEWVSEINPMINSQFDLQDSNVKAMSFESNIDYTGYEHISPLFNAIINKRVLKINYQPYAKESFTLTFHPYYLKQYNNRWFLLGRNDSNDHNKWNMPLDRIESIEELDEEYVEDKTDWEDYFYDVIGVTVIEDSVADEVELIFSKEQAPYVMTKPFHPSQKVKLLDDGRLEVRIKVILNYELESLLLSFGEKVQIISPTSLIERIAERLKAATEQY